MVRARSLRAREHGGGIMRLSRGPLFGCQIPWGLVRPTGSRIDGALWGSPEGGLQSVENRAKILLDWL